MPDDARLSEIAAAQRIAASLYGDELAAYLATLDHDVLAGMAPALSTLPPAEQFAILEHRSRAHTEHLHATERRSDNLDVRPHDDIRKAAPGPSSPPLKPLGRLDLLVPVLGIVAATGAVLVAIAALG